MSSAAYFDSAYSATRMTLEEQRRWEREHQCSVPGCTVSAEDTKSCESCGAFRCDAHTYNGDCANCFKLNDAADELNERNKAA